LKLSVVILAAGKGTRMKSTKAKVLHEICDEPMLYYSIKESLKVSDDVTVITGYQSTQVQEFINDKFSNITTIKQDIQNFPGTGGALKNINPKYEKIIVLNGDMPLVSAQTIKSFTNSEATVIMSIIDMKNPDGYGRVITDEHGHVKKIVEQKDANEQEKSVTTVNAGVYSFKKSFLIKNVAKLSNDNAQKEYYLTDLIGMAKEQNFSIDTITVEKDEFMGVNSKKDLSEAQEVMLIRIREHWMKNGVTMNLAHTIYIGTHVEFENECEIQSNVWIEGKTKIISSLIKSGTIVENANIVNSIVGPMARIRPHSVINDCSIGNFTEVKKSTLNGVKAGHLSYIGDAEIDDGTNIGAGTITCNYDGKKKYKTIIGKNVFVGSDTQLVAPVTVEDDVMIAAGSTVTSGTIKKGSLAISRVPIRQVSGFFYKFFGIKNDSK